MGNVLQSSFEFDAFTSFMVNNFTTDPLSINITRVVIEIMFIPVAYGEYQKKTAILPVLSQAVSFSVFRRSHTL